MKPDLADWFHDVASALAWSLAQPHAGPPELSPPHNDLTQFIRTQQAQLPDYLRAPMKLVAWLFDHGGWPFVTAFHALPPEARARRIAAWKYSRMGFAQDFIRYFESLTTLALYSRDPERRAELPPESDDSKSTGPEAGAPAELRAEIVVIGSGPGGAITACLLAEAGRDVLLVEEGDHLPLSSCEPFSKTEMLQKYRNGGQTVAFGRNKIAYVEGRCVGGGSEINSGLYHRTPPEMLERWRKEFQLESSSEKDLLPHFEHCERDLSVAPLPGQASPASRKLQEGAARLSWHALEVPRWFRYEPDGTGRRQSMTETFIPRFQNAGGKLQPNTRVECLRRNGTGWVLAATHRSGARVHIAADHVFVCAGAVHTPALLRRSGITRNIGNALQVHPTVKIVAQFPEPVNTAAMGVPVHQVKEFAPRLSFGGSISSPAYLALGLLDHPEAARTTAAEWHHRAVYYAMITSEGTGTVRTLPGFRDPLVRYALTASDRNHLADGLRKLAQLLFASGATTLYPSLTRGPVLRREEGEATLPGVVPDGGANLMTIHLFSSCPMGEDVARCAADSFGRVHGFQNLYVNDASLLCTAPGVNPQGSIMAIARRNALKFLGKL